MPTRFRFIGSILLLFALAACSANHNSIYRTANLRTDSKVITVDAKQRAILTSYSRYGSDGKPDANAVRQFCSEPSPDVFSVIAQALSAGGSFGKSADPKSLEIALNAAFSSAEQGSTIPRTQTVNMLRELMFRTCERYMSGVYDSMEVSIQAIRDQRLMVSILAIEQLTGAVAPKPVVIGAMASGSAGASGDAIVRLDDARKAKERAEAAYNSASSAYDELHGAGKLCNGKDLGDADKKNCDDANSAKANALADRSRKTEAYQELSTLARSGGVGVTTTLSSTAPGGLDSVNAQGISEVGAAVREIVTRNFNDNSEVMMYCLRILRTADADRPSDKVGAEQRDSMKSVCLSYLGKAVSAAEERLSAEIAVSVADRTRISTNNFNQFWTATRQAMFANADKRKDFIASTMKTLSRVEQPKMQCFESATTKDSARACFLEMSFPSQETLIKQP